MAPYRRCEWCDRAIPASKRADARYCRESHKKAAAAKRRRLRKAALAGQIVKIESDVVMSGSTAREREAIVADLESTGLADLYFANEVTLDDIAAQLDVRSRSSIKRALDLLMERRLHALAASQWEMDPEVHHLLGLDLEMPDAHDTAACEVWAARAAVRFLEWEAHYMSLPDGSLWIREEFHKRWITEVLLAYATGGYLQIMSPPRHGKSELLTHFAVWMICRNPNIRILWFGPNDEIVEERVGKMEELLEMERLVRDTLPPGKFFAPPKRGPGVTWQKKKFTVDCRLPGIAGNTVTGMGRGKKMLSMNADLIVCDDIEDFESTESVTSRKKTRRWARTQLDSRKEEHTMFLVIGSRQHLDDWYSYNERDPNFRTIVNRAHAKTCRKDPTNYDIHIDCMLFPQLRTYRWLMTKKHGSEASQEANTYDMVYLNDPQAEGIAVFVKTEMEGALNAGRSLGSLDGIPAGGRRVVGGLDPSATGFQAAVCWAAVPLPDGEWGSDGQWRRYEAQDRRMRRYLVELDNRRGGGIDAALELIIHWYEEFRCLEWVIEENGFQRAIRQDPRVKEETQKRGIHLQGHQTQGRNKWDRHYGVGAMNRLYRNDLVDLPYRGEDTQRMVDQFVTQHLAFTDDPAAVRKATTDILMAAWFPQKVIRRWEKEAIAQAAKVRAIDSDYRVSYPGLDRSGPSTAPWR
jgi:hypothetical protein